MSLQRGIDGSDPVRRDTLARNEEIRYAARTWVLGTGTLACPHCDAPVAIARPLTPVAPLACPYCGHAGALRDFLSLSAPSRPARVVVRVVPGGRTIRSG